jgi:hypothetical protein
MSAVKDPLIPEVILNPVDDVLVTLDGVKICPFATGVEFPLYAVAVPRVLITKMKF